MKKILLTLCGLTALTLASCTSCKCEEKMERVRKQRHMRFRSHINKMQFKPEMRQKMHDRNKKQHKKG
jgi:hypothetical protein